MMFDETWVSVKEKKPKQNRVVKVMCTDDRITDAYLWVDPVNKDDYRWMDPIGQVALNIQVTHWKY